MRTELVKYASCGIHAEDLIQRISKKRDRIKLSSSQLWPLPAKDPSTIVVEGCQIGGRRE